MNTSFQLKFNYSEKEFRLANQQYFSTNKRLLLDFLISILIILSGVYLMVVDKTTFLNSFFLISGSLYLFLLILRNYILPIINFRREPKYQEEYLLNFSDTNIIFQAGNINSQIEWNFYKGIIETKNFINLIYAKDRYTIIPKRVFKYEDIELFKQFVKQKISNSNK